MGNGSPSMGGDDGCEFVRLQVRGFVYRVSRRMNVPKGKRGGVSAIALLAVLALAIGALMGPATGASGDPVASAAGLKKCLKKAKRISDPVKRKKAKKKCRKKFATTSLVRATLTWDATNPGGGGNIDLDLWVFDSNGNKARAAADTIPNTNFTPNITSNPGTETFTDLAYKSSGAREFSYGVCYQDGGSQHVIYNLDYVTADGVHHKSSEEYGSDGAFTTFNGGAPIPTNFCKAP